MKVIVGGNPRPKVISGIGDSVRVEDVASAIGSGSLFQTPTVQAVALSDSLALIAWIDTEEKFDGWVFEEGASDPTLSGGGIRARRVTMSGTILPGAVPGFPIRTNAQCIRMGDWNGVPYLAWADGEHVCVKLVRAGAR